MPETRVNEAGKSPGKLAKKTVVYCISFSTGGRSKIYFPKWELDEMEERKISKVYRKNRELSKIVRYLKTWWDATDGGGILRQTCAPPRRFQVDLRRK